MESPTHQFKRMIDQAGLWHGKGQFQRGDYLVHQGEVDDKLYFIEHGAIRVYTVIEEVEHTIRLGYSQNFIGAMDSFFHQQPSELNLEALKSTEVLWVGKEKFMQWVSEEPSRLAFWIQSIEFLILTAFEREKDLLISDPKLRLDRVLKRSPQVFQEIPHKYIASYLRMTPETLSRLQKS